MRRARTSPASCRPTPSGSFRCCATAADLRPAALAVDDAEVGAGLAVALQAPATRTHLLARRRGRRRQERWWWVDDRGEVGVRLHGPAGGRPGGWRSVFVERQPVVAGLAGRRRRGAGSAVG